MISREYVLCAAIWVNDGNVYENQPKNIDKGFVVSGRRHHNCFATIFILTGGVKYHGKHGKNMTQGFLSSHDRFLNREEAMELALLTKQVLPSDFKEGMDAKSLISERLY